MALEELNNKLPVNVPEAPDAIFNVEVEEPAKKPLPRAVVNEFTDKLMP